MVAIRDLEKRANWSDQELWESAKMTAEGMLMDRHRNEYERLFHDRLQTLRRRRFEAQQKLSKEKEPNDNETKERKDEP